VFGRGILSNDSASAHALKVIIFIILVLDACVSGAWFALIMLMIMLFFLPFFITVITFTFEIVNVIETLVPLEGVAQNNSHNVGKDIVEKGENAVRVAKHAKTLRHSAHHDGNAAD
jgi:K+-sensing histidine kinase KdpD